MTRTLLCIGLAPALDRYAWFTELTPGAINRPHRVEQAAGGKGFNSARAARALGVPVRVVAAVGGPSGAAVRRLAADEGIAARLVGSGAETRQCSCLLDEATGALTEVYEPQPPVASTTWPSLSEAALAELGAAAVVAVSGRAPAGLPGDAPTRLVAAAAAAQVPILVDAAGPTLAAALAGGPSLVKVNAAEAADVLGVDPATSPERLAAGLQERGAATAVVTSGAAGSVLRAPDGTAVWSRHPPLPNALAVGSGDAFLAGLAAAWIAAAGPPDPVEAMLLAAAAGRANALHLRAGLFTAAEVAAQRPAVRIDRG